jgi:membrane dipeptidase
MASHSGCRALRDHPRCKYDEAIEAVATTGGTIGICVLPGFLGLSGDLNALLDHIDHAVSVVGPDHVAIGTDVCYIPPYPEGLKGFPDARWTSSWWGAWKEEYASPPSQEHRWGSLAWTNWPMYTVGLVSRGYSDEDIRKIIGGNTLRVLEANEPEGLVRL